MVLGEARSRATADVVMWMEAGVSADAPTGRRSARSRLFIELAAAGCEPVQPVGKLSRGVLLHPCRRSLPAPYRRSTTMESGMAAGFECLEPVDSHADVERCTAKPASMKHHGGMITMGNPEKGPGKLGAEGKGNARPNPPRVDPKVQQAIGKTAVKGTKKK